MIKTSGYRVSPTEVEEVVYATGRVAGAAALGIPHPVLGQAILLVVGSDSVNQDAKELASELLNHCRRELPSFMVPGQVVVRGALPHNQNGKIDRRALTQEYAHIFEEPGT